jgi:tRNA (cmo5U34)-methyltransferase
MSTPLNEKSSTRQIRERFDNDVERFSQLQTGQSATMDAPLAMQLITDAAVACTDPIQKVLDLGCGAGNNSIKLRQVLGSDFDVDLLDLSQPMLTRAVARVGKVNGGRVQAVHADFRDADLQSQRYDVVLAAAVLHHLRDDTDWRQAFTKIHRIVAPGGSVWITDLVWHELDGVQEIIWNRYGDYLSSLGGRQLKDRVFEYIDLEDSPRPLTFQLDLLREVGFARTEVLHKNACFAAFGAVKASGST